MTLVKLKLPLLLISLLLALALTACATPTATPVPTPVPTPTQPAAASVVFPGDLAIADWKVYLPAQAYHADNLFDLVDGQADAFFAYNFQQVTTQRYQNAEGTLLNIEVWQLAQPADAYGLLTLNRAGSPVKMGNEGDADPGRRLAFWQDRYYVHVNANKSVPAAQITAFAEAMSAALPTGGERPALAKNLPAQGLAENSFIFFHQELSVQDVVWLGGENILGLSPKTDGVAARYTLEGTPAHLLLIQYPAADQASSGLQALRKAKDLDLIVADVKGRTLGAVFGKAGQSAATALLQAALAGALP